MDVLTAALYFILSIYICIKFNGIIKFIPIFYLLIYFFMMNIGINFFDDGLFPGKSDQYMYIDYGKEVAMKVKSINPIIHIQYAMDFCQYPVIGYWCLVGYYFDTALFSPVEGLRILNFIFSLIGLMYLKKTGEILFCNHRKEKIMMLLFSFSPSVIMFNFYIIRDSIMLHLFVVSIYYLVKIYLGINNKIEYIKVFALAGVIFNFREQLALAFIMFFVLIKIGKQVPLRSIHILIIYNIFWMSILYVFGLVLNKQLLMSIASWTFGMNFWTYILPKFLLYTSGLGFLVAKEEISMRIIQRMLALDSIIVPFLFMSLFVFGKLKKHKNFLMAAMSSYLLYFSIYIYAEMILGKNYGFHFRAMLPFYYIFMLFLVLNFKEKVPR